MALVGASIFLAACGADSGDGVQENRQFANDPAPTRAATEVPTEKPTVAVPDEPRPRGAATPADLLGTRGAPSTLYKVLDGRLVALHADGATFEQSVISLGDGGTAIEAAASPTGDRVGVVLTDAISGALSVQFFDAGGELLGGPYALRPGATPTASPGASPVATPVATPLATPVGGDFAGRVSLSWEPQGNGVLLVAGNTLFAVDVEGGARVLPSGKIPGTLIAAQTSPTGEQILLHTETADGGHRVYLVQRDTDQVDELFAMRTEPGMGLTEVGWLPSGNGVVFVEGEVVDDVVVRGQLFRYRFRDEAPQLLATSGRGGPSATIRNVAVAPDGASVAYEVAVRDLDQWSTHSMWVRPLKKDSEGLQLPVDPGHTVTDVAWSSEGLVWWYTARHGAEGDFFGVVAPDGVAEVVAVADAMPSGTPAASPKASPVIGATPVASPGATPVGTPMATPVG